MFKKFSALLILILILTITGIANADVAINSTNFPDENFRNYVSVSADINGDETLTDAEISAVTIIDVNTGDISSLKGIENFSALIELFCYANNLTELDVSANKNLQVLECDNNRLTDLDLTQNTSLLELECELNYFATLDLSKNTKLYYVKCYSQIISDVDVTSADGTFSVNIADYVGTSNLGKILPSDITGYNADNSEISPVSYSTSSGIAVFQEYPYSVTYKYGTGYYEYNSEVKMDVTLTASGSGIITTNNNNTQRVSSGGGSSGGCNTSGAAVILMFAMFFKFFNFFKIFKIEKIK